MRRWWTGLAALVVSSGAMAQADLIFVGDASQRCIQVIDASTGRIVDRFTHPDLVNPIDLARAGDLLYVRDHLQSRVYAFRISDGASLGLVNHGQSFVFSLNTTTNGHLLLGVTSGHARRIQPSGTLVQEYRQPTFVTSNKGVAETATGEVLTANFGSHTLGRFAANGTSLGNSAPASHAMTDAEGLQVLGNRAYIPLSGAGVVLVAQLNPSVSWLPSLNLEEPFNHFLFDASPASNGTEIYVAGIQFPSSSRNLIARVNATSGEILTLWEPVGLGTPRSLLAVPGRTLRITPSLGDYSGDPALKTVTVEVRDALNQVRAQRTTLLDTEGAVTVRVPDAASMGQTSVHIKVSHWLTRRVTWSPSLGSDLIIPLINGDVDEDNAVTVFDYDRLSAAFDSTPSDPHWDPNADLDGDASVTVFDYDVLSRNFDLIGD